MILTTLMMKPIHKDFSNHLIKCIIKTIGLYWVIVSAPCFFGIRINCVWFNCSGIIWDERIFCNFANINWPTIFQHLLEKKAWKPSLPEHLKEPIHAGALIISSLFTCLVSSSFWSSVWPYFQLMGKDFD